MQKIFGIPQNRERVFIISIRKDIDNGTFKFPLPITLKLRLKDILEEKVDEKFYLTEKGIGRLIKKNNNINLYTAKNDKFFSQQLEIYY